MTENKNAAVWFIDRHIAEGRADKVAFREADGDKRDLTYGRLARETSQFAGALYRHGVRREERIAMIVRDQIEFPVVFWGALKAGAIPVPINTLLSSQVYETILTDSRASILVVSQDLWDVVEPAIQGNQYLRAVLVIGDAPSGTESYTAFTAGADPVDAVDVNEDELAFWLYSSGSTGLPKGVRHVHSSMRATAELFGHGVVGITEDDVVYSVAKIFFAYGLGNAMSFPLSVGATTILLGGRPTPDVVFDIFEAHKPTIFCGVPTLYAALVAAQEQRGGANKGPLRLCTSAGEALPRDVGERWKSLFGVDIIDGVGSTEMLHIFLSNRPGDIAYGTSGLPVPGYEVRLVDEHDEEVGTSEVGELLVRGPSSADGYWNRRNNSQSTFQGHWTRTGDKYERTAEGRFVYCGRTDDMFKVSGIWVSPFEVEQALIEHPAVLEAAVVPWADEKGLEKPKAYVVLKDGQSEAEIGDLKEFVKDRIGMWKYPRWVELVSDLPKTATGKIQRFKLRESA
ncbi:4-hydroxybenzoate--CoA/benzoate--CoA ligase [Thalassovita gelatinovora]|uniref:4-hydroxybenzoate--CoA/benzoate--CoA ligase n=1 Tax=Thalassovita gelatinovora TaxID=53501 RepID=A0A0P1F7Q6_THAGE|nr:benzoate-CoA ligase family protein [Thalassovita gelatinovora]QIZ80202.1 benzoate-CoA ligase family protein [Thalassovita gelatinovora]CUH64036.1 4-hydroxybenzoate--CoA/benzoate--CoA ligase [Thalassovita gelatinovora]SEQ82066.1 benzoate-CoA ligase [Thalassovita gelatinovora]